MTACLPASIPKLRVLDLFSGIGGFSLGLERTGGFETVAFCEIEEFPRRVLAKHWPNVPCYRDVRELTAERLAADGIAVDVICGGFPCQDISLAGNGAGLAGERSGLFFEIARLAGELRPQFVILENVGALLHRGLDAVLGTLASLGLDAEWHCIPAAALGAPHRRDRVWIVAYPNSERVRGGGRAAPLGQAGGVQGPEQERQRVWLDLGPGSEGGHVADTPRKRRGETRGLRRDEPEERPAGSGEAVADAGRPRLSFAPANEAGSDGEQGGGLSAASRWWATEPDVGRVAHGVPSRVDRLRCLGNAVVPQIPELIGNAILASIPPRDHGSDPARGDTAAGLARVGSAASLNTLSHNAGVSQ